MHYDDLKANNELPHPVGEYIRTLEGILAGNKALSGWDFERELDKTYITVEATTYDSEGGNDMQSEQAVLYDRSIITLGEQEFPRDAEKWHRALSSAVRNKCWEYRVNEGY